MSFGGPPKITIKPQPPLRGSFLLDHGGECKSAMTRYLECLESSRGSNKKCRALSKSYLECRMQRKLMDRDSWENLGFHEAGEDTRAAGQPTSKCA